MSRIAEMGQASKSFVIEWNPEPTQANRIEERSIAQQRGFPPKKIAHLEWLQRVYEDYMDEFSESGFWCKN